MTTLDNAYTYRYNSFMDTDLDNRSKLMACALRLFVAHGYDGVGVQEIVDGVGVTKPTLYHYFGSKLGLLEALLGERMEALLARLRQAADYHHDLPKTLNEVARVYFDFARDQPMLARLNMALWLGPLESEARKVTLSFNQQQYALLEGLFKKAALDHGNMRNRHQAYAVTFLGMLNNYINISVNGLTQLDDKLRYQAVHQFMHGIYS
jgi:TetR/AcrR family transcriptional regulator